MTRDELVAFLQDKCAFMVEQARNKNEDYVGGHPNPFFNFDAVELLDVCEAEIGLFTRMMDKIMRFRSFIKRGVLKVKSESITDTLVDLACYSLLAAAKIESRRRKQESKAPLVETHLYEFSNVRLDGVDFTILGAAEQRAGHEWVMTFDNARIDAIRGATRDEVLLRAERALGANGIITRVKAARLA